MANNAQVTAATLTLNGEQPKRELTAINQMIDKLNVKKKELDKAGDVAGYKKVTAEIQKLTKEQKSMEKGVFDLTGVLKNLSGATMRDLIKAQKELTVQINNGSIKRNTAEWTAHQEKLKAVKAEIASITNESKTGQSGFMKFANFTNQTWQLFAAAGLAITGVITVMKKYMDMKNELEDQNANLKALTGLEDKDISKLQKYAETMSSMKLEGTSIRIRSSVTEIMEAYKLVGSAKPELLQDADALNEVTKQSMILAAAAGMPLADAVRGTVTALNQYGAAAKDANKYVNALGAGAKFGAVEVPYIAEALTKFGSLAKDANIPIEQSIAAIEVLGAKGYQADVAGTGIKQMFIKMMTGARDTNPAVVGMSIALDNLNKKFSGPGGFNKMVDMFGEREVAIIKSLINERESFKSLSKQITGTNTAMQQAAVASDTTNAKIAQATNQLNILAMQLMSGVSPAFLKLANWTNIFLRVLVQLPAWLKENAGLLLTLSGVITAYTAIIWYNVAATKAKALWTATTTALTKAGTIADIAASTAKAIFTLRLKDAKAGMALLRAEMMINPYVLIGVALAALTIGFYKLATHISDSAKAYRDFKVEAAVQTNTADQLFDALKNATVGTKERKELIDQINTSYGQYFENQLTEASNLYAINKAQLLVNAALTKSVAIRMKAEARNKVAEHEIKDQIENSDRIESGMSNKVGKKPAEIYMKEIKNIFKNNENVDVAEALAIKYVKGKKADYMKLEEDIKFYANSIFRLKAAYKELDKQFENDIEDPILTVDKNNTYAANLIAQEKTFKEQKQLHINRLKEGKETQAQHNAHMITVEKENNTMLKLLKDEEIKRLETAAKKEADIANAGVKNNFALNKLRNNYIALNDNENANKTNREIAEMNETIRVAKANYDKYKALALELKNQKPEVWVRPDTSQYADENADKEGKSKFVDTYEKDRLQQAEDWKQIQLSYTKKGHLEGVINEEQYAKNLLDIEIQYLKKKESIYANDYFTSSFINKINKTRDEKGAVEGNKLLIADIEKTHAKKLTSNDKYDQKERAFLKKSLEGKFITEEIYKAKLSKLDEKKNKSLVSAEKDKKERLSYVQMDDKGLNKILEAKKDFNSKYLALDTQLQDINLQIQNDSEKKGLELMKLNHDKKLNLAVILGIKEKLQADLDLENGLITEKEHSDKLLAIDLLVAEQKIKAIQDNAAEITAFTFQSGIEETNAYIANNKEMLNAVEDKANAEKAIERKSISDKKKFLHELREMEKDFGISDRQSKAKDFKDQLKKLKENYDKQIKLAKEKNEDISKIEKTYAKDKSRIEDNKAQNTLTDISLIAENAGKLSSKLQEAETARIEGKYAIQLKAAKGNAEETARIEAEKEEAIKNSKKKYADIDFAITSAQIVSTTALAIMKALVEPGPAGVALSILIGATGLAELAVANEQREAIKNLWSGGFTSDGDKYAPRGIVHAGEFVANQEAVRSAPMRKVFNLVDYAQRNNRVGSITNEDIINSLNVRQGYANGGFVGGGVNTVTNNNGFSKADLISAVQMAMGESTAVNAALLAQIQSGIKASVSIAGDKGIAKQTDNYNKLLNNAKR